MTALKLVVTKEGSVRFEVHAKPRARSSCVTGTREGALVVQLAAAPVDGEANAELVATLAKALAVPRREVVLVRGERSRTKLVEVKGVGVEDVRTRLAGG